MPAAFAWTIRVYYEDTDAGGIVFYANYLKFFERARTEWLRRAGVQQDTLAREHGALFVVRSAAIDYLQPARLDDCLSVTAEVEKLGRASIVFVQRCLRGGEVLSTCRVKVGCVAAATGAPAAIPAAAMAAITGLAHGAASAES